MHFNNFGKKIIPMELKVELFMSWSPQKDLVEFINTNRIQKENILIITQGAGSYTLFYYA